MNKKKYIIYLVAGILTGLFVLPIVLPFNSADVFVFIFGEPNVVNQIIVSIIGLILILSLIRVVYKGFVKK
ncbi:hypothetical protein ABE096_21385 [Robertmurraya massiliosenegalensis]|uniref:hypothetical protein n=1 Tax=Robertmurraya TaxID=2837507 RepID=UPI0039A56571